MGGGDTPFVRIFPLSHQPKSGLDRLTVEVSISQTHKQTDTHTRAHHTHTHTHTHTPGGTPLNSDQLIAEAAT